MNVGGVDVVVNYRQNMQSYQNILRGISALGRQGNVVSNSMRGVTGSLNSMNRNLNKSVGMLGQVTAGLKAFLGVMVLRHLVRFGASAIELSSQLEEVQNVVDTTFGSMAYEVDAFARSTLESFGVSEYSAKRYMGVLGSMVKSMGGTTDKAYEMAKGFTQLAGDMASFYNLSTDEAFDKIRSGLSGETEPLKALGLNLSVANMEAFALSRGISKAYNNMTEMEKATLRYNYLLSVTRDAQGDFSKTTNTWANQTRLLSENWNTFKRTIGDTLKSVMLPFVTTLNSILTKLTAIASVFTGWFKKFTGQTEDLGNSISGGVNDSLGDMEDGLSDVEKQAKKTLKQVASFDDVIMLTKVNSDESNSGSNDGFDLDSYKPIENINKELDDTISKLEDFLKKAYNFTLELGFDWNSIKQSLDTILGNIWKTIKNVGIYFIECSIKFLKDNSIGAVFTDILAQVADLTNKIQSTVENSFKNIVDIFFGLMQLAFDLVSRLLTDIGILSIIEHMWYAFESLTNVVKTIISVMSPALLAFYDGALKPIVEFIGESLVKVLQWVKVELDKWAEWYTANQDTILEFFKYLGEYLGVVWSFVEPIFNFLLNVGLKALSGILEACRWILEVLMENKEVTTFILSLLSTFMLGTKVVAFATKILPLVTGALMKIKGTIGLIIDVIVIAKNWVGVMGGALKGLWVIMSANPVGAVIAVIAILITTFMTLYKNCEWFRDMIDGIWESICSFIDKTIAKIQELGRWLKKGFTSNVNVTSSGSGGSIGVSPRSFAPMTSNRIAMASGGIVSSPTRALIGEAGAEAVIPLQNSAFIEEFARLVANKGGSSGGVGDIVVKIENMYGDEAYLVDFVRKLKRVLVQEGVRLGV